MILFLFTNSEIPLKKIFLKNSEKQRIIKIFPLILCSLYISAQEIRDEHSFCAGQKTVQLHYKQEQTNLNINL